MGATGSQLITADGVVGTAYKPIRVFSIHILSTGGGGGVVNLRSGAAVTSTIRTTQAGTTSTGVTYNYGKTGFLFESGCYCDIDANTTSVLVQFVKEA